eukprot:CAMPEP_0202900776 /NCGR_PEP_ID=MMETSP1392-20130828/12027_1 /ASSEMBLY_ACC=CAM_ASM_000868 /TAXON_ID=225041 /ORGANISM="Chlamydomonas chlamydogama, Strain SAG 11-48b" /LENGTH=197 /DNA_ID=CAMNT_0049587219 /DNA_START=48 /DNA_END=641 /DNA_ORIENTATION=+
MALALSARLSRASNRPVASARARATVPMIRCEAGERQQVPEFQSRRATLLGSMVLFGASAGQAQAKVDSKDAVVKIYNQYFKSGPEALLAEMTDNVQVLDSVPGAPPGALWRGKQGATKLFETLEKLEEPRNFKLRHAAADKDTVVLVIDATGVGKKTKLTYNITQVHIVKATDQGKIQSLRIIYDTAAMGRYWGTA